MKIYDAEIESAATLEEAFSQQETIKVGNILYEPEHHSIETPRDLDVCQLCRFYRIKGMLNSAIANKVCTACAHADLAINFGDEECNILQRQNKKTILHYLQTIT